ncbi:GGDEF domain-containing protein [Granulicella arctica]|uniref:GGDEF domain-containing protein n=1 Tax=Granulicella arctica TaxID=940613 RepID=UPI0021E0F656|nr:GGDEF domain-containing protein [Granulicella arctica]
MWFTGWAFLLLHYVLLIVPTQAGLLEVGINFLVILSLEACAFSFLWASTGTRRTPFKRIFVGEIAASAFVLTALYVSGETSYWPRLAGTLLLLIPGLHLLCVQKYRTLTFDRLAIGFAVLGVCLAPISKTSSYVLANAVLGAIFVSAAYLTFAHVPRLSRGVSLMVAGLLLWGLTCPLQAVDLLLPTAILGRAILDLPRYILAAGMILSFLDDYVGQTERLALHDPLTGLPNRRLFENRLDAAIEESRLTRTPVACLVIDVDNFKHINDTLGHPVGDGLLQALSKRLSWNLGPRDLLARTGGDEFTAVLVEAADEFHVRFIAGAMMAAGCVPVSIQEHSIDVRISIGVAVSPQDAGTSSELHKAADDAMYRAKRRGGSIVAFVGEEAAQIHAV